MKTLILTCLIFAGTISVANAGDVCYYNGVAYPIGATVGPYVCTPNGWVRR